MRLIDADDWIKEFDEVITELEKLNSEESISREDFIKLVKIIKGSVEEQPTAYDVEKVVEEVKKLSFEWLGDIRTCDVIKIVRKGGV